MRLIRKYLGSGKLVNQDAKEETTGYGVDNMSDEELDAFYNLMNKINLWIYDWNRTYNSNLYDRMQKAGLEAYDGEYLKVLDHYINENDDDYRTAINGWKSANDARAAAMEPYYLQLDLSYLTQELLNELEAAMNGSKNRKIDEGVYNSTVIPALALTLPYATSIPYLGKALEMYWGAEGAALLPGHLMDAGRRALDGNFIGTAGGWNPFNEEENAGALGSLAGAAFDLSLMKQGVKAFNGAMNSKAGQRFWLAANRGAARMGDYMWLRFPNFMQKTSNLFYNSPVGRNYVSPSASNLIEGHKLGGNIKRRVNKTNL